MQITETETGLPYLVRDESLELRRSSVNTGDEVFEK